MNHEPIYGLTPSTMLEHRLESLVSGCLVITPFLLISALVCAVFRKRPWIAPYWVFCICPVLLIDWYVIQLLSLPTVTGPDSGFVGMRRVFLLYGSLWEVIPGILLLLVFPRRPAWVKRIVAPCCIAAVVSFLGWLVAVPLIPVQR